MFRLFERRRSETARGASSRMQEAANASARDLLPPLVIEAERIARQIRMGVHGQRRAGTGEDFWQYRPAEPHEPAARIDWRQSARGDTYWVREREAEAAQQILFWRDPSASMDWRSSAALPTKRDRATLCTLALAAAALQGGERAGLLTGPEAGRHFGGVHAFPRLAESLMTQQDDAPAPQATLMRPWGHAVLVSDFLWPPEQMESVLRGFAARPARLELLCVLDPAELALPYSGRVRFEGLEETAALTLSAVEDLAPAYDAAMRAHLDALRIIAGRHRAALTLHHTDQPPLPALLALHARLTGGKTLA
ncbi:DUF58 domain-containing protein [Acidomonas methanolica]|uniref:DUF58 domain-containing protein n=1 Tax=Acidomonas methanolica NBRC 104435 TaxID=1231351 RepID=A0A023D892_ACIMT|nr:DUF58 domain-containing protein [Acidomonas methanolica]TCS30922.1 uncharacterized protein DUF58 [Acidomonas methanolica]GAJ29950.1 hypothetical protein Amme_085_078 [Acidomonas methanolica NBRC 104435]GBQ53650.1 hypothetical protein AA0498_1979 [Acidomonas methanolica]GEK98281.1 hypothetical protein AME01nite_07800 [Acidomonas methanolica NBRC 104435]